jgi:hypothetical protein
MRGLCFSLSRCPLALSGWRDVPSIHGLIERRRERRRPRRKAHRARRRYFPRQVPQLAR